MRGSIGGFSFVDRVKLFFGARVFFCVYRGRVTRAGVALEDDLVLEEFKGETFDVG